MSEGLTRGRDLEKIEIAKQMLKSGVNTKIIIKCTGLTKEQIEKIEKEMS